MSRSSVVQLLLLWSAIGWSSSGLAQQSYYVDAVNGQDLSPSTHPNWGTCQQKPFRSIGFAIAQTAVGSVPDTVNVLPGTYPESLVIEHPVRIEAHAGATLSIPSTSTIGVKFVSNIAPMTPDDTVLRGLKINGCSSNTSIGITIRPGVIPIEASPLIENNHVLDCHIGIQVWTNVVTELSRPLIRHNLVERTICSNSGLTLPAGILLDASAGILRPTLRSNMILRYEEGLSAVANLWSILDARVESSIIARCEFGVFVGANAYVQILRSTIAHSEPFSCVGTTYGVFSLGIVDVENSIIWVPRTPGPCGMVPGTDVQGNVTLVGPNLLEDISPTANVAFVNPSADDFHLAANSVAIDAATNPNFQAPIDIEYDFDGDPRVLDPTRTHDFHADLGADEYTTVKLGIQVPGATTPSYEPIVDVSLGSTFTIVAQGQPGDLFTYWLNPAPPASTPYAIVHFDLGITLVSPVGGIVVPTFNSSGQYTLQFRTPAQSSMYPADIDLDLQGLFLNPSSTANPPVGELSRRVRLNLNRNSATACP